MGPDTRAMQDDDTANPGMLWVLDGEALWKRKTGAADKACADCHGDARTSMKGVAARYPAYDKALAAPSISTSASIFAAPIISRPRRCLTKAATCWRSPPSSRTSHAGCRLSPAPTRAHAIRRPGPRSLHAARGPAQPRLHAIAMTTIGTSIWRDRRSRRLIRPAIRSTGWNGNRWARCSGDCEAASPASGRRPMITVRPNWSSSNSI